jgi:hypothetical protein
MKIKKMLFVLSLFLINPVAANTPSTATTDTIETTSQLIGAEEVAASRQYSASREAAVKITSNTGHGSGTYIRIGRKFGVLTAAHVVREDTPYRVSAGANEVVGMVIWRDNDSDLALLTVPEIENRNSLRLTESTGLEPGDDLTYSGFPGSYDMLTVACSLAGFNWDGKIIVQGFAWFGSSGSGFITNSNRVVGVVSAVGVETFYGHPQVLDAVVYMAPITAQHLRQIREAIQRID